MTPYIYRGYSDTEREFDVEIEYTGSTGGIQQMFAKAAKSPTLSRNIARDIAYYGDRQAKANLINNKTAMEKYGKDVLFRLLLRDPDPSVIYRVLRYKPKLEKDQVERYINMNNPSLTERVMELVAKQNYFGYSTDWFWNLMKSTALLDKGGRVLSFGPASVNKSNKMMAKVLKQAHKHLDEVDNKQGFIYEFIEYITNTRRFRLRNKYGDEKAFMAKVMSQYPDLLYEPDLRRLERFATRRGYKDITALVTSSQRTITRFLNDPRADVRRLVLANPNLTDEQLQFVAENDRSGINRKLAQTRLETR